MEDNIINFIPYQPRCSFYPLLFLWVRKLEGRAGTEREENNRTNNRTNYRWRFYFLLSGIFPSLPTRLKECFVSQKIAFLFQNIEQ